MSILNEHGQKNVIAKPIEDHIYRYIGFISLDKLKDRFYEDLKAMQIYARCTSVLTTTNIFDKIKVCLWRLLSAKQLKGEFKRYKTQSLFIGASFSLLKNAASAMFKPIAAALIAYLLIRIGEGNLLPAIK